VAGSVLESQASSTVVDFLRNVRNAMSEMQCQKCNVRNATSETQRQRQKRNVRNETASETKPRTILPHLTCAAHVISSLRASRASLSSSVILCHPSSSPSSSGDLLLHKYHKSNGINPTGTPSTPHKPQAHNLRDLRIWRLPCIPSRCSSLSSHCTALYARSHARKLSYVNTLAANLHRTDFPLNSKHPQCRTKSMIQRLSTSQSSITTTTISVLSS
jgi:hypothetical protein